ncbi:LITAF-like zinc ribbon domain-containing protein [Aspergillus keveii]|uniref:LITAF-like zinc ribbon domain-containing protein n=1 Tax=Aspergillus keveii TaxID=714993 RepID=A0ABR4GB45_9EURO
MAFQVQASQHQGFQFPQAQQSLAPHIEIQAPCEKRGSVPSTPIPSLAQSPAVVDCPFCRQRALTSTTHETGASTHTWALCLCIFLCIGFLPYLMDSFKDVQHRCGNVGIQPQLRGLASAPADGPPVWSPSRNVGSPWDYFRTLYLIIPMPSGFFALH